jgi:transposase
VWVPDAAHEAMRDLIRARATAVRVLGRHASTCRVSCSVTAASMPAEGPGRWPTVDGLRRCGSSTRPSRSSCRTYIHAVQSAEQRVARLVEQIAALLPSWWLAPIVQALQAMRGIALIVAVNVAAEVGDFRRDCAGAISTWSLPGRPGWSSPPRSPAPARWSPPGAASADALTELVLDVHDGRHGPVGNPRDLL